MRVNRVSSAGSSRPRQSSYSNTRGVPNSHSCLTRSTTAAPAVKSTHSNSFKIRSTNTHCSKSTRGVVRSSTRPSQTPVRYSTTPFNHFSAAAHAAVFVLTNKRTVASFSQTTQSPSVHAQRDNKSGIGFNQQQTEEAISSLLKAPKIKEVRDSLKDSGKAKISVAEFSRIVEDAGLLSGKNLTSSEAKKEAVEELLQTLHQAGFLFYFPSSLPNWIFLQPEELSNILLSFFDPESNRNASLIQQKVKELRGYKEEIAGLEDQRAKMERVANRYSQFWLYSILGYCIVQGGLVARLTWWEFSWDIMEPVTYMLGFMAVTIGVAYYVFTGADYTYESIFQKLKRRKYYKLEKRTNFPIEKYEKLLQHIELTQRQLAALGYTPSDFAKIDVPLTSFPGAANQVELDLAKKSESNGIASNTVSQAANSTVSTTTSTQVNPPTKPDPVSTFDLPHADTTNPPPPSKQHQRHKQNNKDSE